MKRVIITEFASVDSASILKYLYDKAGLPTVIKFESRFKKLYDRLADFPGSGAPRPNLGPNIRIGIVSPYIILYRYLENDNAVTILRIVHERRKITRKLLAQS